MAASGTNRTVMSEVILQGGGESELISALENANERAINKKKSKKKK